MSKDVLNFMTIEYEATFINIDKKNIRKKLKQTGATLIKPEFLQKRVVFNLPGTYCKNSWARVRNEGEKITMSFKEIRGRNIKDQKEINLVVDDFEKAVEFLEIIGCRKKSYQETKREIWKLGGVEICIDEWPFLEPLIEIEGRSEKSVRNVAEKLGFNYSQVLFCSTDAIYSKKYNISLNIINNKTPKIIFNMKNPFLKYSPKAERKL